MSYLAIDVIVLTPHDSVVLFGNFNLEHSWFIM